MIEVPNIFTPNGDQINDVFELTTTNAELVEFTITNRWGSTVYTGSGPGQVTATATPPVWDGKIDGQMASEGVYFVQYRVVGVAGDELVGQGFVQLSK
jgi:gliding motility-associated-like protein